MSITIIVFKQFMQVNHSLWVLKFLVIFTALLKFYSCPDQKIYDSFLNLCGKQILTYFMKYVKNIYLNIDIFLFSQ